MVIKHQKLKHRWHGQLSEAWPNYNAFLPMNVERYYDFWNRGI